MGGSSSFARIRGVGLLITLAIGVAAAAGCKPKQTDGKASPAASGSAAATGGPCEQWAQKVCAKAGAQSPACTSFTETTQLMSPATCTAGLKDIKVTLDKLSAQRGECDKLVKTLCAAIGPETKTCQMVTTQTANFPPAQCKMMMGKLPEITEELKKMEAQNQPLSADLQAAIAANTAPAFGPENASVKIVEFSDFQCPYCAHAADVVHQIREKYGDKVRFVFRQFPLPFHAQARGAAEAALAANAQGKFWEFHDRLFKNQQALEPAKFEGYAKDAGLNVAQFKKALEDKKLGEQVEADVKLGEQVRVNGTPTMFVNGARVENPGDFNAVATMIDAALKGGTPG
ncbi:MAG TPA: thioredoxin domain-containing protein [Polyangiaceae bacterium]|nr:thioredoxin domain-containing protein [Polyangiaceae bacterium]